MRHRLQEVAVALLVLTVCQCSARSSNSKSSATPRTVYDQKQTGDYNIQLHLKDFQVIALWGGEGSALGDYDYAYDYSDFTVKPATQKPQETSTSHSPTVPVAPVKPESSSSKPSNHPYPIVIPPSPKPPSPKPSTAKPQEITSTTQKAPEEIIKISSTLNELLSGDFIQNITQRIDSNTTEKSAKLEETMAPGKIKVQIIQSPPVGIVADEDSHELNDAIPQLEGGTVVKRCASGFTRDKRGRCRRVRKPANHLPFGFSRFASNLASRFQHPLPESSLSSSSESSEE